MKQILAATAALALLAGHAALAQEQSEMRPPVLQDQSTGGTNGVLGAGKNSAPGTTGSVFGSSTDAAATAGGTGQPGTGDRTIDQEGASGMGASASAPVAGPLDTPGTADSAASMDRSGGAVGGSLAGPAGTLGNPVGGPPPGSP